MDAAPAGGAAIGGPHPNPSGDGPGRLQSLPGKGKPVALTDITNTGRRDATRSLSVAEVVKENGKLVQLLNEKTRIIEVSRVEMQKLHHALQVSRQQNLQLAQTNSQMLAELNLGKDRLKMLQHELSCTAAVLKMKDSELEKKNKAGNGNQWRKEVNSQDVMKAMPSKVAAVNTHQIDGPVTSLTTHQLVESRSAVPSSTACPDPPNNITTKRKRSNKRKSESSECMKETKTMQDCRPHLQPVLSVNHEDPRNPGRRRSSRLNPGSCEIAEVSSSKFPEDDLDPSAPSNFSVQQQYGPNSGEDMSLQNQCNREAVLASGFKKLDINDQRQKNANLKEVQEAYPSVPEIGPQQVGDKTRISQQSHSTEMQSSLPFNISEPSKTLEDTGNERDVHKQKLKIGKVSAIEHVDAKCESNTSEPFPHNEKRKSRRRKSTLLNSVLSDNMMSTSETLHEDVIAPLPPSSSNALMEQVTNKKQTDGDDTEGQLAGRRSLRRAAEKVVSYKEMPLNVKMRRP